MSLKSTYLFIILLGYQFSLKAQDTLLQLDLSAFLSQVKEHHPLALVASNRVDAANFYVKMSKGAFDPVFFSGLDQKYFDDKTYYSTLTSGVKIPTRIGWDVKVLGDWNRGSFLNPENNVPDPGLSYLGLEIPLGRGMFTDEQRTQLKRAQVALELSGTEQQIALNELLYDAGQAFLMLQEQEAQLALATKMAELAKNRLAQMRTYEELGDRAAIDTLEASAQYQQRNVDLRQRQLLWDNARLQVEQFLWDQGLVPLKLDSALAISPLALRKPVLNASDSLLNPYLATYGYKLRDLTLERKLKLEQLKPEFNINYNLLQTPNQLASAQFNFANYKWGLGFYMPLLLRKERNSLRITGLKLENTKLELSNKQRELETKLKQIQNEWSANYDQALLSAEVATSYEALSIAETRMFDLGESSLFMINAREMSYISSATKYIESLGKLNKSALSERYIRGDLGK
jgi:hypothetical protein